MSQEYVHYFAQISGIYLGDILVWLRSVTGTLVFATFITCATALLAPELVPFSFKSTTALALAVSNLLRCRYMVTRKGYISFNGNDPTAWVDEENDECHADRTGNGRS
jgi:hypothetical protein